MRGRSGEGRRSGATEREADIDILSWRGRRESGHEHQGKHNGRGRGTKKRRVGADVGSRTDEAGAGGGHTTGERGRLVCVSIASRVEKDLRANFPRSPNSY